MSGAPGPKVQRHLAAIFAADVEGYSRLMGVDEVGTLRTLTAHREIMDRLIGEHGGRIANTAGDSVLAEFPSVVDAVQAAVEVQEALRTANEALPEDRRLLFRIGVHIGDVLVKGGDLFGDGVNIAARLQAIAEPGGVCISGDAHRHVRKPLSLCFIDLGPQEVKNIAEPVSAFRVDIGQLGSEGKESQPLSKPLQLPDKPSIAVLPFTNMSGDPDQEYFADGVVEEIITALSRVKWLFVIARNSSFTYKGRSVDVKQIGRELGVRYVLEGSMRKAGNRVRITGQLIEATSGVHVWAERYDRDLTDIFVLQDEITEQIVGAIEPSLRSAEIERAKRKPPNSLDAYDLYLRALPHYHSMRREEHEKALTLLRRARKLEPDFLAAVTLTALCYLHRIGQGWSEALIADRAKLTEHAEAALRLDSNDPEALAAAAQCFAYSGGRWQDALTFANRAVILDPNSASCWTRSGWVRMYMAYSETAVEHFERAARLSPLDPTAYDRLTGKAVALLQLRRFEEAAAAAAEALRLNPAYSSPFRPLAAALAHMGRLEDARAVAQRLLQIEPNFTISAWSDRTGATDDAKAELAEGMRKAGLPE
jgi:adenylate cyclase